MNHAREKTFLYDETAGGEEGEDDEGGDDAKAEDVGGVVDVCGMIDGGGIDVAFDGEADDGAADEGAFFDAEEAEAGVDDGVGEAGEDAKGGEEEEAGMGLHDAVGGLVAKFLDGSCGHVADEVGGGEGSEEAAGDGKEGGNPRGVHNATDHDQHGSGQGEGVERDHGENENPGGPPLVGLFGDRRLERGKVDDAGIMEGEGGDQSGDQNQLLDQLANRIVSPSAEMYAARSWEADFKTVDGGCGQCRRTGDR